MAKKKRSREDDMIDAMLKAFEKHLPPTPPEAPPPLMGNSPADDWRREDRIYQAIADCNVCRELTKRLYHLGQPRFSDNCGTAQIRVLENERVIFEFGRRFFDSLGDDELLFVVLHETLHYALGHHRRRHERDPFIWNVACDLVVNEFLLVEAGFDRIKTPGFRKFLKTAVTFDNVEMPGKHSRKLLTAEQVYELLVKDAKYVTVRMALLTPCDEHNWAEEDQTPGTAARALADSAGEVMQELFDRHLTSWGDLALGEFRAANGEPPREEFDWDRVLSRRLDSIIKEAFAERWAPSPRKIAWLYPNVLIPADQLLDKPRKSVLLAIDTSGSVSPEVMTRFLGLARGIPKDRVEVSAVSFDTQTYEFDLWGKQSRLQGGGGTCFNCIERYAQKRPRYPDLVIVLTDGFADRPTIRHGGRWFWVLSEQSTSQFVQGIGQWAKMGAKTGAAVEANVPF